MEDGLPDDFVRHDVLTVDFTIGPSGTVEQAAVKQSNTGSPEVDKCILREVRTWGFPKPEGGGFVTVTYPFMVQWTGG